MGDHGIKAIIFDCFGVLTTDGWLKFRDDYLTPGTEADDQALELNHQADAGFITQEDFVQGIAKLGGVDIALTRQVVNSHARNDKLFDYIRDELKPHYLIGMLSNVSADYTDELFTPEQNALFNATLFSFEVGVTKPHPAMYQTIANRLGVLPEECIFIDDREVFVTGARDVGMQAFRYTRLDEFRQQLEVML